MNYDQHVLGGIITYPIVVVVAALISEHTSFHFGLTTLTMAIGYALYVLGSDLPDVDHPQALIHRGTKPLFSIAVAVATYVNISHRTSFGTSAWMRLGALWAISAMFGVGGWFAFTALMPRHRGVVHSVLFAVVYGLLGFGLGVLLKLSTHSSAYLGFAAFCGYMLHLLLDGELKLV